MTQHTSDADMTMPTVSDVACDDAAHDDRICDCGRRADAGRACPVKPWIQSHRTMLLVCLGVFGLVLLLMLGNRKTVMNVANQPSQAGGNNAKVIMIDNHGFSMFQWIFVGNGSGNCGNSDCGRA
ncbi:hypothetical protein [Bifidobacterium castoris]|uniref:Uncharacterized protein n=1 Tax=Bifidobacterium castoris TaxID=2306972 RepID=A0A430F740_9BIFI|nr:hypothetical protein [Bifidobacterium castoris]RSX48694.1 hypothetical protein D2E22_0832 [Bifidobacterium castoris]